jgi:hypothetical protein
LVDISEIWDNLEFIAAFVIAVVLIILSLRIRRLWLRYSALALASLVLVIVSGITFIIGCDMVVSNARIPAIASPDRKHIAIVRWWLPGALGSDMVHVSIRHAYSPIAVEVEKGDASPPDPKVEWLDDHRLLITYWDKGQIRPCSDKGSRVEGIEVFCKD